MRPRPLAGFGIRQAAHNTRCASLRMHGKTDAKRRTRRCVGVSEGSARVPGAPLPVHGEGCVKWPWRRCRPPYAPRAPPPPPYSPPPSALFVGAPPWTSSPRPPHLAPCPAPSPPSAASRNRYSSPCESAPAPSASRSDGSHPTGRRAYGGVRLRWQCGAPHRKYVPVSVYTKRASVSHLTIHLRAGRPHPHAPRPVSSHRACEAHVELAQSCAVRRGPQTLSLRAPERKV